VNWQQQQQQQMCMLYVSMMIRQLAAAGLLGLFVSDGLH
jgi:hypothetical protein